MFHKFLIITLLFLTPLMGCDETVTDNGPSTNKFHVLQKTDLSGKWYYAPTVIDVPHNSRVTFPGETAMSSSLISWEISQEKLLAKIAQDNIHPDTDDPRNLYVGNIIGSWDITHVDVYGNNDDGTFQVADDSETIWSERKYILVDWSVNHADKWALLWPNSITIESLGFNDDNNIESEKTKYVKGTDGEINYLGVSDLVLFTPEVFKNSKNLKNSDSLPDCFEFGTQEMCTPTEALVRHVFTKKDPKRVYVPSYIASNELNQFGYLFSSYVPKLSNGTYDYDNIKKALKRWDFFENSVVTLTTPEEAEQYANSNFHSEVDGVLFTCPGENSPCSYLDDNAPVVKMGFYAFTNSDVASSDIDNVYCPEITSNSEELPCFYKDSGRIYVKSDTSWLANSDSAHPVELPYDERKLRPMVYYLNENIPSSLLGEPGVERTFTPSASSPVGQAIEEWSKVHNKWLDLLGVSRSMVSLEDGTDVDVDAVCLCPYVPAHTSDDDVPYAFGSNGAVLCEKDVRKGDIRFPRFNYIESDTVSLPLGYGPLLSDPQTGESISIAVNLYGPTLETQTSMVLHMGRYFSDPYFRDWEDLSTTQGLFPPTAPVNPPLINGVIPQKLAKNPIITPELLKTIKLYQRQKARHEAENVQFGNELPKMDKWLLSYIKNMVKDICPGGEWDDNDVCKTEIFQQIKKDIVKNIALHEMGHNMGLAHNLRGSFDSVNYHDEYWTLRFEDGIMGERITDPITENEISGRLEDYAYSTVMDYAPNPATWNFGLGKYDKAAITFSYGQQTQVFDTVQEHFGTATLQNQSQFVYPSIVAFINNKPTSSSYVSNPTYVSLLEENRSYLPKRFISTSNADPILSLPALDPSGESRWVVPYMNCDGAWNNKLFGCHSHDRGADAYEITNHTLESYKIGYHFNNFSRTDRGVSQNSDEFKLSLVSRYFDTLQFIARSYQSWKEEFFQNFEEYYGSEVINEFFATTENGWGSFTFSYGKILDNYFEMITSPEPGFYQLCENSTEKFCHETYEAMYSTDCTFEIPVGDYFGYGGKYLNDGFIEDPLNPGEFLLTRHGYFHEKALALELLSNSHENLSEFTPLVSGIIIEKAGNFNHSHSENILRFFTALQGENWEKMAPLHCADMEPSVMIPNSSHTGQLSQCQSGLTNYIDPAIPMSLKEEFARTGMNHIIVKPTDMFQELHSIHLSGDESSVGWTTIDSTHIISFEEKETGTTYIARVAENDEVSLEFSIAAYLLTRANILKADYQSAIQAHELAQGTTDEPQALELMETTQELYEVVVIQIEMIYQVTQEIMAKK
jgi:hypothetical protein